MQGGQRRIGVGVKQALPLVAVQLRGLVRDMRRRARILPTAAECIAGRGRILCGYPHNAARFRAVGSGGVTGAADQRRRRFVFNLLFGDTPRITCQAIVVRKT